MTALSNSRSYVNKSLPTGHISSFGFGTIPAGYLACDGSAVSRTTYANLFLSIGTTYGIGDGSTTFNIPNTSGLFLRGAGSQTISSVLYNGSTIGTKVKDKTNHTGTSATTTSTNSASVAQSGSLSHAHAYTDTYFNGTLTTALEVSADNAGATYITNYSNTEVGRTTAGSNTSLNHSHTNLTNTVSSSSSFSAEDNETAPGYITTVYGIKT